MAKVIQNSVVVIIIKCLILIRLGKINNVYSALNQKFCDKRRYLLKLFYELTRDNHYVGIYSVDYILTDGRILMSCIFKLNYTYSTICF